MDENILKILGLLIHKIGEQNFSIEEKVLFYDLSNGFLFNQKEVIEYKEIGEQLVKELAKRERE